MFNHLAYIQELREQDSERTNMWKPTAMNSLQRRDGRSTLINEILRQPPGTQSGNAFLSYKEEKGERKQGDSPALREMRWGLCRATRAFTVLCSQHRKSTKKDGRFRSLVILGI